jgi:hypothetical protein
MFFFHFRVFPGLKHVGITLSIAAGRKLRQPSVIKVATGWFFQFSKREFAFIVYASFTGKMSMESKTGENEWLM